MEGIEFLLEAGALRRVGLRRALQGIEDVGTLPATHSPAAGLQLLRRDAETGVADRTAGVSHDSFPISPVSSTQPSRVAATERVMKGS